MHAPEYSPEWNTAHALLLKVDAEDMRINERMDLTHILLITGCKAEARKWLDTCLAIPVSEDIDRRQLARLLLSFGYIQKAADLTGGIDPMFAAEGYLFPKDKRHLEDVFGTTKMADIEFAKILHNDDDFDQLWRAREYVETYGDKRALKLITDAANSHCDAWLEAINCLDELGFRYLARKLFSERSLENLEPYDVGAQFLRFGFKMEAAPFYLKAARSRIEYNETLVWSGLADLRLTEALRESYALHKTL